MNACDECGGMKDVEIKLCLSNPDEFHESFRELSEQIRHVIKQRHEIELVENDLIRIRDDVMTNCCAPPEFRPLNTITIKIPGHLAKH